MTPVECIDYVIIHELAHLKEMNHSKKFRDLVDTMARDLGVDYKLWRKWLKINGKKLDYL
jgi:predicted metal-dependent hydrolase